MMPSNIEKLIALDVGERRIGVAIGDSIVRLASPYITIQVDGTEIEKIRTLVVESNIAKIVIGYPRNQSGEETAQTQYAKRFADKVTALNVPVVFQDESLTSVMAEDRLKAHNKSYTKEDIDAYAASIILNDYLETAYAARS